MLPGVVEFCERRSVATPADPVLTAVGPRGDEETVSWLRLVDESRRVADQLAGLGIRPGGRAMVAQASGPEHVFSTLGAWMAGLLVLPVPDTLAPAQLPALTAQFPADAVIDHAGIHRAATGVRPPELSGPPDGRRYPAMSALLSGGTTADPRVILRRRPWQATGLDGGGFGRLCRPGDVTLVSTPLYGMGFQTLWDSLLLGNHTIVLRRFAPTRWLRTVETHRVTFARVVPSQMKWIAECRHFPTTDLTSLRVLHHSAAACPDQVKRAWLARLSPGAVYESYSSREDVLSTLISGQEWLAHPGSVGRVPPQVVRILDDDLRVQPAGQLGRIFLRPHDGHPVFARPDARLAATPDGRFLSVGDIGMVDEDGYLYLVDRVSEVFSTGGHSVFPAQIERRLAGCAAVYDCVVVGEPDGDLGHVAVAYVSLNPGAHLSDVVSFAAQCLSGSDLPRRFLAVPEIPRDESGKIARRTLASTVTVEAEVGPPGRLS